MAVAIWDHGTYELVEEKKDGGLTVRLHGERLQGLWTLVPAKLDGDPKNWLIIRKREQGEQAAERRDHRPMLATLEREVLDDRGRGPRFVQRIEVQTGRALAQQLFALSGRVLDSELRHRLVVVAHGRTVATGTVDELLAKTGERDFEEALDAVRPHELRQGIEQRRARAAG